LKTSLRNMFLGKGGAILFFPNELVFYFWSFMSVPIVVKIHQEMQAWECTQTDTRTEANWFYNLSHAMCHSYGTDNDTEGRAGFSAMAEPLVMSRIFSVLPGVNVVDWSRGFGVEHHLNGRLCHLHGLSRLHDHPLRLQVEVSNLNVE